jgi:hypothetical protein
MRLTLAAGQRSPWREQVIRIDEGVRGDLVVELERGRLIGTAGAPQTEFLSPEKYKIDYEQLRCCFFGSALVIELCFEMTIDDHRKTVGLYNAGALDVSWLWFFWQI